MIIHNLYALMIQSHEYHRDLTGPAMTQEITSLLATLRTLTHLAPRLTTSVPPEIISYIENGRNPDIYNREFVEVSQRMNQQLKGKSEAFGMFRDVLAREIVAGLGMGMGMGTDGREVEEAVGGVVRRTGGKMA